MNKLIFGEARPFTAPEVTSDEKIVEALSEVEVDDPYFKELEPITNEDDMAEMAALGACRRAAFRNVKCQFKPRRARRIRSFKGFLGVLSELCGKKWLRMEFSDRLLAEAKAKATIEVSSDPLVKNGLKDLGDRIAQGITDILSTPISRRGFLKKSVLAALPLALVACGINPGSLTPIVGPDGTATPKANSTETAIPPTATSTETPIAIPTSTETPEPSPTLTATDYQVAGKDYLVSFGNNKNIPEYQFTEGQGWQKVEQLSMVDAFGNTVPGWVVEKSAVWDGEVSDISILLKKGTYYPTSGLSGASIDNATLKQWELREFISNGIKMERLITTWSFKNDQGKIITVKLGMPELNSEALFEKFTPRELLDSLKVGDRTSRLNISWVDVKSTTTPQRSAALSNAYALNGELCKQSVQACGLSIARLGDVKHPTNWFSDQVFTGQLGYNLDLSEETWAQRWNPR